MAEFSVPIVRVEEVIPIEGADKIEAVRIGGYQSITQKGQYKPGDLVAYIPEQALVPLPIQQELGLEGRLAGAEKNRVKAIKLKGVLSQGLVYPFDGVITKFTATLPPSDDEVMPVWNPPQEGDNVADLLRITKYEPTIPAQFAGRLARPRGDYQLINYDIENIKRYNRVLEDGEEVFFTEKIHGTLMQCAFFPETDQFVVSSKGLGARGFVIEDTEANASNVYLRAAKKFGIEDTLRMLAEGRKRFYSLVLSEEEQKEPQHQPDAPIFLLGEVFGQGIQDLSYASELEFRAFDAYFGKPGQGAYIDAESFYDWCERCGIPHVPVLYHGPFTQEALFEYTNGMEAVSGKQFNLREGIVIRPAREREARGLGRVILKSVSEAYLLRKGGTEFN